MFNDTICGNCSDLKLILLKIIVYLTLFNNNYNIDYIGLGGSQTHIFGETSYIMTASCNTKQKKTGMYGSFTLESVLI